VILALTLVLAGPASAQRRGADVPFVATHIDIVHRMLELARVTKDDVVCDLGSGDGRIVIAAAKRYGARGIGVEIDPALIEEARQNADSAGVGHLVEFRQGDLFQADIGDATVITLFLGPALNERLRPKLFAELRPGTRIVSHFFEMGDWQPDSSLLVEWGEAPSESPLHLWVLPANVAGTWRLTVGTGTSAESYPLRLRQRYQRVAWAAKAGRRIVSLSEVKLAGDRITFTLGHGAQGGKAALRFSGRVEGDRMEGTVTGGQPGEQRSWIATRVSRGARIAGWGGEKLESSPQGARMVPPADPAPKILRAGATERFS
jgi:precorrin-6B methylase 2